MEVYLKKNLYVKKYNHKGQLESPQVPSDKNDRKAFIKVEYKAKKRIL
jgi:hypothetical protein